MEEEETKCEPGAPGWVVTFGDMMSLLLTFFILLLSFAKLEKTKHFLVKQNKEVVKPLMFEFKLSEEIKQRYKTSYENNL